MEDERHVEGFHSDAVRLSALKHVQEVRRGIEIASWSYRLLTATKPVKCGDGDGKPGGQLERLGVIGLRRFIPGQRILQRVVRHYMSKHVKRVGEARDGT